LIKASAIPSVPLPLGLEETVLVVEPLPEKDDHNQVPFTHWTVSPRALVSTAPRITMQTTNALATDIANLLFDGPVRRPLGVPYWGMA
jgi:hypothetical protein